MNKNVFLPLLLFCSLCFICVPVGAVMQEVTVKGSVATISPTTNTLTVENPLQYGCSYPVNRKPGLFLYPN